MTPLDALLLVLYVLIVYQVLTGAIAKLDKRAKVNLSEDKLKADLEARNLQDMVKFKFKFEKTYSLSDSLKKLSITVTNKSNDTLYVDWDRSSLTNFKERSRRVIRLTPNKRPDLIRAQVVSAISPMRQIEEEITAEDVFNQEAESASLDLGGVIVPVERPKPKKGQPEPKGPPTFYLYLWVEGKLTNEDEGSSQEFRHLIPFEFIISKRPWTDALPW
ncbi:MAG: hypothetical protein AAGD25_01180 [Cyanobacteria bacterium P01_F01_bin.150]